MQIISSPRAHFKSLVEEGLEQTRLKTYPAVIEYLVLLLENFVATAQLFPEERTDSGERKPNTLAELWLTAQNKEEVEKRDLLKQLGDRSLYLSGYFPESIQKRGGVDVDYYIQMGENAYTSLAHLSRQHLEAKTYHSLARQFSRLSDVLFWIGQKTRIQSDQDLIRLYDRYQQTGCPFAREELLSRGVILEGDGQSRRRPPQSS